MSGSKPAPLQNHTPLRSTCRLLPAACLQYNVLLPACLPPQASTLVSGCCVTAAGACSCSVTGGPCTATSSAQPATPRVGTMTHSNTSSEDLEGDIRVRVTCSVQSFMKMKIPLYLQPWSPHGTCKVEMRVT